MIWGFVSTKMVKEITPSFLTDSLALLKHLAICQESVNSQSRILVVAAGYPDEL